MCRMEETYRQAAEDEELMEKCVLCGRTVPVRRDSHITGRRYYVEGAGQLCARCFYELYHD